MCLICAEYEKGKMTSAEALRALGEMIDTEKPDYHYYEVMDKLMDEEETNEK